MYCCCCFPQNLIPASTKRAVTAAMSCDDKTHRDVTGGEWIPQEQWVQTGGVRVYVGNARPATQPQETE